jgi:pimeloyl-ACP methyl ester carboxylesterase
LPNAIVNGARINYLQVCEKQGGDCDNLVMVHGLAANMAFWYLKYACEFAKDFRVTVFDVRGHGRSEMTPSGYAPANLAQDMAELLDKLNIDKAHFVAHSFGGVITMNFALQQMERVQSLVLADTHITAARRVKEGPQEWSYGHKIQAVLDQHGMGLDTRDPYFGQKLLTRVAEMQLHGVAVPPELFDFINPMASKTVGRTAAQWLRLMQSTAAEAEVMGDDGLSIEALRKFKFPIIAMYGDRSPARLTGTELLNVWPHAEFRNVRNAGHFFPVSRPDEVITACRRFWQGDLTEAQRRHRAGETQRGHFRSDRIFKDTLGWYFTTRELQRVGPFAEIEEAHAVLTRAVLNNIIEPTG